jgi:hypothetical protein
MLKTENMEMLLVSGSPEQIFLTDISLSSGLHLQAKELLYKLT